MNKTVLAGSYLNKCTEIHYANDLALVDRTNLWIVCNGLNDLKSLFSVIKINARNEYVSVVVDVNLDAAVSGNFLNDFASLTDNFAYLVNGNLCLEHFGSVLANLCSRSGNSFQHYLVKYIVPCLMGLRKCFLDNFRSKTVYLDVNLNSGDTLVSTAYLKVHIAEKVFQTLNIHHCHEAAVVSCDKTAGNTRNRSLDRHACVHKSKSRAAYRTLRR